MSPVRVAISVLLTGLVLCGPASALPGRDALNAAKDAARGAVGELNAEITVHTRSFVAEYSINDRYVIEAARIAQRRSSSSKVQAFAQTLADDARTTEGELQTLLRTYNVDATLATGLDFRRRGMISELNTTPALTRRYLEQQVLVKKEQRILLKRYAHSGRIIAVRQFAERRLRKVDELLSTLENLQ